jgi:spore coat protein U-like protein
MICARVAAWLLLSPLAVHAAGCSLSVIGVSFGSYDVFNTQPLDISGTINVSCDSSTSYSLSLSSGSGSFTTRLMTSGVNRLAYNLYQDPTRLTIWGDGAGGTSMVNATGLGAAYPVFGRIRALQNVPVGAYADTITVTLTF